MRKLILPMLVALVVGCASSAPSYFTLDMVPSGNVAPALNIKIGHISVTDALAGKNILIKKSPTEIEYYALDQWAGGLNDLLSEKFQAEFGDAVDGRRTIDLSGELVAFEQVDLPGGGAEAHVRLLLAFRPDGASRYAEPLLERSYDKRLPTDMNPNSVVLALSECVEAIAADIAADAATLPAGDE